MATIREGDACPDFELPETDGGTIALKDLVGNAFILYFYPKDDTSGCTTEAVDFSALADDFAAIAVPVIGVSPDPVKKHVKFRDKHDLKVRLLSDEEKSLIGAFGLWVEKSMYGRKYMGVERTTVLVDAAGRISRIWPKVSVSGHAAEVLEAAKAAKAAA